MGASQFFLSKLTKALSEIPGESIKTQAVGNFLKKKGVQQAELDNSGMSELLNSAGSERLSVAELKQHDLGRPDKYSKRETIDYAEVTLGKTVEEEYDAIVNAYNKEHPATPFDSSTDRYDLIFDQYAEKVLGPPTYREHVYSNPAVAPEVKTDLGMERSSHFKDPDYVFHTRVDEPSKDVLRVQELQSDLHTRQAGQAIKAYSTEQIEDAMIKNLGSKQDLTDILGEHYSRNELLEVAQDSEFERELLALLPKQKGLNIDYQKTALAAEMANAKELGKKELHLAIRPTGVENLERSESVQKTYETTVRNKAKKFAKSIGSKVSEKDGYLILTVPAVLSMPAYADTNELSDNYDTSEDEIQRLRDADFSDEEIIAHLDGAQNVEQIAPDVAVDYDPGSQEQSTIQNQQVLDTQQEQPQSADALVTRLQEADFTPDEIALHIRESGLAAPGTPDLAENNPQYEDQPDQEQLMVDESGGLTELAKQQVNKALDDEITPVEILNELKQLGANDEVYDLLGFPKPLEAEPIKTEDPKELRAVEIGRKLGLSDKVIAKTHTLISSVFDFSPIGSGLDVLEEVKDAKSSIDTYEKTLASYNNAYESYGLLSKTLGNAMGILDESQVKLLNNAQANLRNGRVEALVKAGYSAFVDSNDQVVIEMDDGTTQVTNAGFWSSLIAAKHATLLGIAGEEVGRRAVKGKIKSIPGAIGAAALGAGTGAFLGKYLDLAHSSAVLQEKFSAGFKFRKALDEGGAAFVMVPVGFGVLSGLKGTVNVSKSMAGAGKRILTSVERTQAQKALVEQNYILPEEASKLIEAAEVRGIKLAGKTELEKSIAAKVLNAGKNDKFRGVVENAAALADGTQLSGFVDVVNERAKGALGMLKDISKETDPKKLIEAYKGYEEQTSEVYRQARDFAIDRTEGFRFDFKDDLLKPLESSLKIGLQDTMKAHKFARDLKVLETSRTTRSVEGLLDLLPLVNKQRFLKSTSVGDKKKLGELKGLITNTISKAITEKAGPAAAKEWTSGFKKANMFYNKMRDNRSNVIVKTLSKKNIRAEDIESTIVKYINDPEVLNEAFKGLSTHASRQVENIYFTKLAEKFEITKSSEVDAGPLQALDFHKLSQAMQGASPKSAQGKQFAHLVRQYATMFRADPATAQFAKAITKGEGRTVFHTDATNAIKANFLSKSFNTVMRYMPTQGGRSAALVHVTSKLLHSPMDAKAVARAIRIVPKEGQQEFRQALTELQQNFTKLDKTIPKTTKGGVAQGYHQTKFGAGKVAGRNGSLEFSTEGMLDVSGRTDKEILLLLDNQVSLLDKGFTSLATRDKIYMLDEAPELSKLRTKVEISRADKERKAHASYVKENPDASGPETVNFLNQQLKDEK